MDETKKSTEKVEKTSNDDKLKVVEEQAKKEPKKSSYKQERKRILQMLRRSTPGTTEYRQLLISLHALEEDRKIKRDKAVSGDTIVKCATSAVVTTAMFVFESENPIRSRLLSFIPKII